MTLYIEKDIVCLKLRNADKWKHFGANNETDGNSHVSITVLIKILFCILVKPGVKYREIGNIIQKHAQAHGYAVVKSFCGHGIHE